MENFKIAKRIPSHYVSDDCLQTMFGYGTGRFVLVNPDEVIYDNVNNINKYLEDERRHQFPYSTIPTHYGKVLFKKCLFVNQILNFDTPYLNLTNKGIFTYHAVKDGKDGLIVTEVLSTTDEVEKLLTRKEVEDFFHNERTLFIHNGEIYGGLTIPTREETLELYKTRMTKIINNETYLHSKEREQLCETISKLNSSQLCNDYELMSNGESILMISGEGKNMTFALIQNIKYVNEDLYRVIIKYIPLNVYNLEQLKNTRILNPKEPKINLKLNPDVSKEEVEKAQQLILRRK
ncbi:MAG: hypothetical protein U0M66_01035 [Bacilli bacterium]|nr:hypothetical protein [Bacilli bacterium]